MRVIVIGAGVVGSSLAYRLAEAGARITLIDRARPGQGTTGSSFAWTNANSKTPQDYFALNVAGMRAHAALRNDLGAAPWLSESGNLVWTLSDGIEELEARVARLRSWDYPAEWLDRRDAARLESGLRIEPDVEQLAWFPSEGWVDAPLLAMRMTQLAIERGAIALFAREVATIERAGGRVAGVTLANGERIDADLVVNCAGPRADRVARLAGRELPLAPTRGLIARISGAPDAVGHVIHAPRVHLRPDGGGLIALHHDDADDAIERGEAPERWANELLDRARDYVPALAGARLSRWSIGVRPIPADERSSAGLLPSLAGYAEIVTHSGVTLGPLLARLVAQEIVTGTVDPLLAPFRPERFAERRRTVTRASTAPGAA